jgi:hypothetical protein
VLQPAHTMCHDNSTRKLRYPQMHSRHPTPSLHIHISFIGLSRLHLTDMCMPRQPELCTLPCPRYYESGQMELTTLGNFGRLSVAHSKDGLASINSAATGG